MAKVKITGHASGSGVITVTAPNTSTDRTITLPDATGSLTYTPSITDGGNANAITIDASENVGIGTASPTSKLHIHGNSATDGGSIILSNLADDNTAYNQILFQTVGDDDTTLRDVGSIQCLYDDHGGTNPSGNLKFSTKNDAGTFAERLQITSDGRGLSQFTAKAWVNWNMATPAIADSHNISSITDSDVGDQLVNFTNNMANSTYVAVANGNAVNDWYGTETTVITVAGSQFRVIHKENNVSRDSTYTGAIVFGD